jgi:hypothetical protein
MIFYHQTSAAGAKAILVSAFRNGVRSHGLVNFELRGVWISQEPVGMVQLNGREPRLLEIKLPDNLDISEYELIEEGKPYREWCVPAELINQHGSVRLSARRVRSAF